jgi:PST family polysaccharide transporter
MAPVGFVQALTATTGVVFMALGRTRLMLKLGLLGCTLQVGAYVTGVRWGLNGVAASILAANLLNAAPCLACAHRCLAIPMARACATVVRPFVASLTMAVVLASFQQLPPLAGLPLLVVVAAKAACGACTYLLVLGLVLRQDLSGVLALVRPSRAANPAP